MERTELVNQCARLVNSASAYNADNQPEAANAKLAELLELLTAELIGDGPAEPEKPKESETT